jgi:enoyl-CoA hydratase/carnithine racemase
MSVYQTLIVERRGPVATITLNRPEVRNALDIAMRQELVAALDEIEGDAGARPRPHRRGWAFLRRR